VVVLVGNEVVQCTVNIVILAGFYFYRNCGKCVEVVNQIIDLSFAAVVVIKKIVSVSRKFLCDNALFLFSMFDGTRS
jgi:hypothetical protein